MSASLFDSSITRLCTSVQWNMLLDPLSAKLTQSQSLCQYQSMCTAVYSSVLRCTGCWALKPAAYFPYAGKKYDTYVVNHDATPATKPAGHGKQHWQVQLCSIDNARCKQVVRCVDCQTRAAFSKEVGNAYGHSTFTLQLVHGCPTC